MKPNRKSGTLFYPLYDPQLRILPNAHPGWYICWKIAVGEGSHGTAEEKGEMDSPAKKFPANE